MKRRHFLTTVASIPAAAVVVGEGAAARAAGQPGAAAEAVPSRIPLPQTTLADAVAVPAPGFFSPDQFAALKRMSEALLPPDDGMPGAIEARAAEFVDFWVSTAPVERQELYKKGLDDLNAQAQRRYQKPFGALDASQIDSILKPMFAPYPGRRSANVYGPFVNEARMDLRTATQNSPEAAAAADAAGRRISAGLFWHAVDPTVLSR